MSYEYNFKFWLGTADEIKDLILRSNVLSKMKIVTQDKKEAHDIFSLIYSKYISLVNQLAYLFDVTCQVQKRALVQRLLEAATNRLFEIRNELKQIELSEFIYLDNSLVKLKIQVDDIQILRPYYYPLLRDSHAQALIDDKIERPIEKQPDSAAPSETSLDTPTKHTSISKPSRQVTTSTAARKQSKAKIRRRSSILMELAGYDMEKYKRLQATILIKIHDKARKARVLLTNIRYHPEKYRPKAPDIGKGYNYAFTHKADQPMLILVKRTFYDSNYFIERQISQQVDYYVRPVHRKLKLRDRTKKKGSSDDFSDEEMIMEAELDEDEYIGEYEGEGCSNCDSFPSRENLRAMIQVTTDFNELSKIAINIYTKHDSQEDIPGFTDDFQDYLRRSSKMQQSTEEGERKSAMLLKVLGPDLRKSMTGSLILKVEGENNTELSRTSVFMDRKSRQSFFDEKLKIEKVSQATDDSTRGEASHASLWEKSETELDGKHESGIESLHSILEKKILNSAATRIQTAWNMFKLNRRVAKRNIKKYIMYGMISDWTWDKKLNKELEQVRIDRRNKKSLFDEQFIKACEDEKTRIMKVRGPWIMEDISDHIRAWFREFYDGAGEFDRYPEEFEGGTILVLRGETMTVEEFVKAKEEKKNKKKKSPEEKKKEREKKKAEREKLKEQKKKEKEKLKALKKLEAKMGKTYDFSKESTFFAQIKEIMEEYDKEWDNIDEINNVKEDPYMEWISLDKFAEAHQELRITIDELMRVEFELLRKALADDRRKKYKPQKKKKQKKKKGKKGKGKKQPKDITADRSIDSLYFEMKDKDLFLEYPLTKLDDYIAEYNYSAYEKRMMYQMDPQPGQGEVKDIIREAIYGMGPLTFPKVKSLCLMGPPRGGKKFLVNAIATEAGAVLIDISPEKVVQFEDDMKYFVHLVTKMARILQPAILFIDECERIFWKKVPKDQQDIKPRLLGKYIIKQIVKPIKKDERVMVLGITDEPFKGKLGKMKKCFEKTIIIPRADYGTTFKLTRDISLSKYGVQRNMDFSALAMVTSGFTSSMLYDNIQKTLGIERRMKFNVNPLKAEELIEGYINKEQPDFPITEADYGKYLKYYSKVNKLAKQRAKYMRDLERAKSKEKPKGKKK